MLPNCWHVEIQKANTVRPPFRRGVSFQDHPRTVKIRENSTLPPKKTMFLYSFLYRNTAIWGGGGTSFFSCQLLEAHAVCLEDPFEMSNNSDAPVHWTVRVTYFFCSWDYPVNLQSREVRNRKMLGMSVADPCDDLYTPKLCWLLALNFQGSVIVSGIKAVPKEPTDSTIQRQHILCKR